MMLSTGAAFFTEYITPDAVEAATYTWGSEGSTVREIQTKLKQWGYYNGTVDGKYGYQTWLAVRKFQEKNGIKVDGIAGPATLSKIGINTEGGSTASNTVYSWGARGETVREIQRRLKNWGYYDGSVDGVYGYGTWAAVKKFQQKRSKSRWRNRYFYSTGIRIATGSTRFRQQECISLAAAIYGESRGEPYTGQVAVGAVILNRVRHSSFPNTIAVLSARPLMP